MKRAVLLAGGTGSRLRPFTLKLNKGMAPIYCPEGAIPQILFPLKTLINSGITEILIVTSRDHCGKITEVLGDGTEYNCNLTYRIQEMNRPITGIAQALGLSKDFVGTNPFAVILGDNYYEDTFKEEFENFSKKYETTECGKSSAAIFLKPVIDASRFGVAEVKDIDHVVNIIEKPKNPVSNLAVTGLYLYTQDVFNILPTLLPSARQEIEITDLNNHYVKNNKMKSYFLKNEWSDMGLPESAHHVGQFLWNKHKKEKNA